METMPIKIVDKLMDMLCDFDFEKASEILKKIVGDSDKYEVSELKYFIKEKLLYVYQKAIGEESSYYFCSTGHFRIEYNDGDFRVALELVEWNTSY